VSVPPPQTDPPPLGDLILPRSVPLPRWKRLTYLIGGIACVIGGVVGWLIPVVTGIPFYIAGAFMLAAVSPKARRFVNWCDRKLPERARRALRRGRLEPPAPPAGPAGTEVAIDSQLQVKTEAADAPPSP
jgi:hypothetical protein